MLEIIFFKSFNFPRVEGRKHIGVVLAGVFLLLPMRANAWSGIKAQVPGPRMDITAAPHFSAPLELPVKPMWPHSKDGSFWNFPTEARFVAFATKSAKTIWVANALERYRIHLMSPLDLPYILGGKAPTYLSLPKSSLPQSSLKI